MKTLIIIPKASLLEQMEEETQRADKDPPEQRSAVANKPAQRAASPRMCCEHTRWTPSVINLQQS